MKSPNGIDYGWDARATGPLDGRVFAERNQRNHEITVYDERERKTYIYTDLKADWKRDFKTWAAVAFDAPLRGTFPNYYVEESK